MLFRFLQNHIFSIPSEIISCKPFVYNQPEYEFIDYCYKLPQTNLFELENINIFHNCIFDSNNNFLPQFTWFENDFDKYIKNIKDIIKNINNYTHTNIFLKGSSIFLGSTWGSENIGHCILDGFSRLYVYEQYGIDLKQIDNILINNPIGYEVNALINAAGIDKNKIKFINTNNNYICEHIFISEMVGRKRQYKKCLQNFYTNLFPRQENLGGKILLTRKDKRLVENMSDLVSLAKKYDIEICYEYPSIDKFATTDMIISPHSCTLTKLIFCRPQTKVIELISNAHQYSYYYELSRVFDLKYTGLLCKTNNRQNTHNINKNFKVDVDDLEKIILQNL